MINKLNETISLQADKINSLEQQLKTSQTELKDMSSDMTFWRDKAFTMQQDIEDQVK